jgi:hypothetical protein
MTRAMFVQALWSYEGRPDSTFSIQHSTFRDVVAVAWYFDAVVWASDCGIVLGFGDGRFNPNAPITREQMAVMLVRYMRYKGHPDKMTRGDRTLPFADEARISSWALDSVRFIQAAGIVHGRPDNRFDPQGMATRAEAAAMLVRLMKALHV